MAIMAPFGGPLKMADLQGKSRRVRGSVPFGGRNGLVCLLRREKYCHNGGMALRAQVGMGAVIAPFRPHYRPPPAAKIPCKSG